MNSTHTHKLTPRVLQKEWDHKYVNEQSEEDLEVANKYFGETKDASGAGEILELLYAESRENFMLMNKNSSKYSTPINTKLTQKAFQEEWREHVKVNAEVALSDYRKTRDEAAFSRVLDLYSAESCKKLRENFPELEVNTSTRDSLPLTTQQIEKIEGFIKYYESNPDREESIDQISASKQEAYAYHLSRCKLIKQETNERLRGACERLVIDGQFLNENEKNNLDTIAQIAVASRDTLRQQGKSHEQSEDNDLKNEENDIFEQIFNSFL